jgi:GNAT superfamily N-acetyltransferase
VPLIIRPCRLDECEQVLDLWRKAEAIPRPTDTLPELERMVREHPETLLVGEERGRIVGSVIAGWDGWRGGIYRLAMLPECRRRGVAQALVAEAERRLDARGGCRRWSPVTSPWRWRSGTPRRAGRGSRAGTATSDRDGGLDMAPMPPTLGTPRRSRGAPRERA